MLQCCFCRILCGLSGGAGNRRAYKSVLGTLRYVFERSLYDLRAYAGLVSQGVTDDRGFNAHEVVQRLVAGGVLGSCGTGGRYERCVLM